MTESREPLEKGYLKQFGTAKIGGLSCNKRAPATLRIDLEVDQDRLQDVIEVLGLEMTDELRASLTAVARGLKIDG